MLKVTLSGLRPTQAMIDRDCPILTPELLAAVGARYSRNGEGLHSILSKIETMNPEAAVDNIFSFVDYGHQSIMDMVPVPMFVDSVSLYLVMKMWHVSPTASGQESSTRYIKFGQESTVLDSPHFFEKGASRGTFNACSQVTLELFAAYDAALRLWDRARELDPSLLRIPKELLESTDPKEVKKRERIIRNFAFDRARYFIPMSAYTNVMMIMSARNWVQLIQYLYGMGMVEASELADQLAFNLSKVSPRAAKYAKHVPEIANTLDNEFYDCHYSLQDVTSTNTATASPKPFLEITGPSSCFTPAGRSRIAEAMEHHTNRYHIYGEQLRRLTVRFGWEALPIGEIRDLNRHRTGNKYMPTVPVGSYVANDEVEALSPEGEMGECRRKLMDLYSSAEEAIRAGSKRLDQLDRNYVYWLPLGTQCFYEHTTQAHFFAYQVELRTGLGTHYQYARRMRESLDLWHQQFPATKSLLVAGTAEPE